MNTTMAPSMAMDNMNGTNDMPMPAMGMMVREVIQRS